MEKLDFKKIASRLREIRLQRGYTQEYIADKVDVSVTHISNIENNHVKISLSTLVQVCKVLDVTVDYVLENEFSNSENILDQAIAKELQNKDDQIKETILKIVKIL